MDNVKFLSTALTLVESESIRNWAKSDHNLPILLEISDRFISNKKEANDLATWIVIQAIGL